MFNIFFMSYRGRGCTRFSDEELDFIVVSAHELGRGAYRTISKNYIKKFGKSITESMVNRIIHNSQRYRKDYKRPTKKTKMKFLSNASYNYYQNYPLSLVFSEDYCKKLFNESENTSVFESLIHQYF